MLDKRNNFEPLHVVLYKHKYIYSIPFAGSMQESHLELLRCPVTRSPLRLHVISRTTRKYKTQEIAVILEAILFAEEDWFYPIIDGIPRLLVESYADHSSFLQQHLPDYDSRRQQLEQKYPALIRYVNKKNSRT